MTIITDEHLDSEERKQALIRENIESVEERIRSACRRAGRDRSEVSLICVTKTKPEEMLREAYEAGQSFALRRPNRKKC